MTDDRTTRIRVREADADALRRLKESGESWPDLMTRLLDGDVSEQEVEAARMLAESSGPAAQEGV